MDKLTKFLKARDMTGKAFAAESGVSEAALSRIITGKTRIPDLPTVLRIQDATAGFVSVSDWPRE